MELQNMGERVFAAECIQKKRIRKVYKCWFCPINWQYITYFTSISFRTKNCYKGFYNSFKVWIIFLNLKIGLK